MRIEKRLIVVLMVLLMPGLLWSMEESQAERNRARAEIARSQAASRARAQAARLDRDTESAKEMRIFALEYRQADMLARIIDAIVPAHEATIAVDTGSQSLIVMADSDRLQQIERVIRELDIPSDGGLDAQQMMYRVYMLELPPKHFGFRPFSIMMMGSAPLPPDRVLTAGNGNDVQIESFEQIARGEERWQFAIRGRAASYEPIDRLANDIEDCEIMELEWEDDTPIMPTTRVPPLPKSLQAHIRKFLGEETGIVGYWFGNLSVPGEVQAPIGPWGFEMSVERSTQEDDVELEISVTRELPGDPGQTWQILSNSIRGKIDRPVIIGYNRDNRGVQTMGALVVVPEVQ